MLMDFFRCSGFRIVLGIGNNQITFLEHLPFLKTKCNCTGIIYPSFNPYITRKYYCNFLFCTCVEKKN